MSFIIFMYMSRSDYTSCFSISSAYLFWARFYVINLMQSYFKIYWSSIRPKKEGRLEMNLVRLRFYFRSPGSSSSLSSKLFSVPLNPIFFLWVSFIEGCPFSETSVNLWLRVLFVYILSFSMFPSVLTFDANLLEWFSLF